jgi:uncharacterized phage protein (TIGR02218 family)
MSRTLSVGMASHLATRSHSRCNMLLLELRDGTSIGITDHTSDLTYDLGDGSVTYDSRTGILPSDVAMATGLDSANFEVRGPINEPFTRTGVLGGKFDRARARLFQVNWKDLTQGDIKTLAGNVAEARVEGGEFILEVRSDADRYNQVVGRVITNTCDADFADQVRCFATATEIEGTVTAATSGLLFQVSFAGAYANNFFNLGTVVGLTGVNAGVTREIFDWSATGGIEAFAPFPVTPEVGDTFAVRNGCGKSRQDCMAHDGILWVRGYPEVPGRKALMPAVPGA